MKKITLLSYPIAVFLLNACNIYEPLTKRGSPEEYLESAQACLHKNDYTCAIENYNSLPAGSLKNEKLCTVYLAKGGVTLKTLISVIPTGNATMLGALANTLIPWDSTKAADLAAAKTHCTNLASDASTGDTGVLLKTVGNLADCAVRMAKTASFQSVAEGDSCSTPNASAPTALRNDDLGPANNAALSTSTPGMCTSDAIVCVQDISAVSGGSLTGAGLTDIATAFSAIPSELKDSTAATEAAANRVRTSLRTVIP